MSQEMIAIIAVGVGLFGTIVALGGMMMAFMNQSERRTNQRIDRLEDQMNRGFEQLRLEMNQKQEETNRGFEQLRAEMNQGFAQQGARIRNLEQGQAYMSGQFSELKDHLTHRSDSGNNPDPGD